MYIELTLLSYIIDLIFGESKFKHIVAYMGDYIKFFESNYYKNDIKQGAILSISLVIIVLIIGDTLTKSIESFGEVISSTLLAILGSMLIASNMLYESVKDVALDENLESKRVKLSMLVSRDCENLNESEINKALIETYGENLSDGVIAPLFYMLLFGLSGALVYKAINTLDSMVGYKNDRYINFGKFSAKFDDVANYIPARITAFLILLLNFRFDMFKDLRVMAKAHESPNAGYPITAIALAYGVRLGGDTSYFKIIKRKSFFGNGKSEIESQDVLNALKLKIKFDIFIILSLLIIISK